MEKLKVFRLHPHAKLPTKNKPTDAGYDLYALEDVFVKHGSTGLVKTGIALYIPNGFEAKVSDRSGMARRGLIVGAGVLDPGYNGDVTVVLHNFSCTSDQTHQFYEGYQIRKGDRIAQVVFHEIANPTEIQEVEELWHSERGDSAWSSSGK